MSTQESFPLIPPEPMAGHNFNDITYAYDDAPTCRDFACSNAFMRGLMGPFGSGKSSVCVQEITNRAMRQRPGPDGIRHSKWGVIRNCYDDETEILTEQRGWKLFRDLLPEDKVAQLNGEHLEFVLPTMHYAAPYRGDMVGFDAEGVNFCVTPDHKMWVSERHGRAKSWAPYGLRFARDIEGRETFRVRRHAKWQGRTEHSVAFFEWLGFWFAEGCARVGRHGDGYLRHTCIITQHKPDGIDYAKDLFARAGLSFAESKRPGGVTLRLRTEGQKELIQALAACGKAVTKAVPDWIKAAPAEHLRAFIHGFVMGDGWKVGPSWVAATSSPQLADDLQEIALKAGLVANIHKRPSRATRFGWNASEYAVTFVTPLKYQPQLRRRARRAPTRYDGWTRKPYDGIVYCVEVPTHVVYVRRRGRAMWCSQTYPELRDTTIRTVFSWLPPQHFGRYVEAKHSYQVKAIAGCDIEILFLALDRPDDIKKLLSLELTGAWINEAREVPWSVIEAAQGRVGRYPARKDGGPSWFGLWMDTNPPDSDSKWYRYFEEKIWLKDFKRMQEAGELPRSMLPEQFARIFKQPSGRSEKAENLSNLPGGRRYYYTLSAGKSQEWVKVYCDGEYGFVVEGKLVYPEYSDQIHCKAVEPIEGVEILRSWDFGLTPACIFSQLLPDGRWLVFDEMTSDNMSVDQFGDEVIEHCVKAFRGRATFRDVGDPAGDIRAETDKKTAFDILRAKDIDIVAAVTQDPTLRQEAVRLPLRRLVNGEPQFILHPRCKVVRKGFMGGYHRRRMKTAGPERYSEKPEKNEYCVPMHTEALTPRGWKTHAELAVGDEIYGYDLERQRIVITKVEALNLFGGPRLVHALVSKHLSWVSTPDHRNIATTRAGVTKIVSTRDLNDGHRLMCAGSEERPPKQHPFSDEFISLAAWVMAEGTYRPADDAIILNQSESHNPDYCAYLDELLAKFPGTIRHTPREGKIRGWRITKETAWALRQWMPGKVPSANFIARMSNSNRRRFLYEFIRGDGHAGGNLPPPGDLSRVRDFRPKGVTPRAFQKLAGAADALQMMAVLSGLRCIIRSRPNGHVLTFLSESEQFSIQDKTREGRQEDGVWCPTTTVGTWVCRQNGQTFITGNSHPHDGLQYGAVEHFASALIEKPRDPDEDMFADKSDYFVDPTRSDVTGY